MADQIAQSAGATAEAEESTPQQTLTQQASEANPRREVPSSGRLLDSVLAEMDLPTDVLEQMSQRRKPPGYQEPPKANLADLRRQQIAEATGVQAEPDEAEPEPEPGAPGDQLAPDTEAEPEPEPEATAEESAPELEGDTPTIFDSEDPLGEEWTPEQRAQILDGRKKLRKRTQELEQLTAKAQELLQRVQMAETQPRQVQPTFNDPLPEVMSAQQLVAAAKSWKRAKRWAEDHPEGAEKGVDKGPDGEDLTKDYSPEEVLDLRRKAEDILDEGVPARAHYLQTAAVYAQEAAKIYPELFKNTPESAQAAQILALVPEIKRAPDFLLWIGRAVLGPRKSKGTPPARAGADAKPLSRAAETILGAPKLRTAPTGQRTRSMEQTTASGSNGVRTTTDRKQARTDLLKSELTDKDLESYIARRLGSAGRGGRAAVLA